MPTIGWFEILIVVGIAIIVLGPKDFPVMLKKVGSWIGSTKKYINNYQNKDQFRSISDYISGMTDRYAIQLHKSLK